MFKAMILLLGSAALGFAGVVADSQITLMTDEPTDTPTYGFALTVNHAAVSVRYSDGSFRDLGRIEASEEYIEMMKRLSKPETQHPTPPYHNPLDQWNDQPRQWWRSWRKRFGYAASPEAAILANALRELMDKVSETYQPSPGPATISMPALLGLYHEDINDAAAYVNIVGPAGASYLGAHELVTAFLGFGLGTCKSLYGKVRCEDVGETRDRREAVAVEYTELALSLHGNSLGSVQEDPWFAPDGYDVETSWDLGSDRNASQADLRDFVSKFLHQTKRWCEPYNTPAAFTFMLTGSEESLKDGKVQSAIQEAVLTCNHSTIVEFTSGHNFVTARGAAKMATLPTNDMLENARNFQLYR